MDTYIFDACSMIYLTKIQVKENLPNLGNITISTKVKNELIDSIEKYPDANTIKNNLNKKLIQVAEIKGISLPNSLRLGQGELETIEICKNLNYILVCDDKKAYNYAKVRGLKPITSEIILLQLVQKKIISLNEFEKKFDDLANLKVLKQDVVNYFKKKVKISSKT